MHRPNFELHVFSKIANLAERLLSISSVLSARAMGVKLVPTPKVPKSRSLAIRLIAKVYQLCILLFGRSARALKRLDY